ncbi:hypothetical protein AJ79_01839 [Helicocarpus griseus UAMH5409]|uniref:Transcription factor RfeG n=1 Tax=Helicocarpus griseus UAMH5409 TaxID=1447875 RepID=A0A2B7Y4Z2_9EURO|nr:hypothetical protein AJ79_01839 [Helicocarpus griseus UAMH5409]
MSRPHGRYEEPPERQNEYFIEKNGIAREVIQADICRYLGNQALVKPGTHQGRQGYFIRAYRNLTPEMIADLKADSARWEAESAARRHEGQPPASGIHNQEMVMPSEPNRFIGDYNASDTHENRQRTGPSVAFAPSPNQYDGYGAPAQYSYSSAQPGPYQPSYSQPTTYGAVPPTYAPVGGPYPAHSQPPVSSPEYTYGGDPPYPAYNNDPRANPRYPGPGYDNEPEYAPVVTSSMGYPPTTIPDHRAPIMDGRYPPDQAYRAAGPPPPRDRRTR